MDTVILVVSFGTSFNENRSRTIGAVEREIKEAFPDCEVRRAFTSDVIIDKLKKRDGTVIDTVSEAIARAREDGFKKLLLLPTHIMKGFEYGDVVREANAYLSDFDALCIGEPLLSREADFDALIEALIPQGLTPPPGEAILYMGHGTAAQSNEVYFKLQETLFLKGYKDVYIGTVEAKPAIHELSEALRKVGNYKKITLRPLMLVAGDHANNDMAGDGESSWKSILTAEGFDVCCELTGLGQLKEVRSLYVEHTRRVFSRL